MAKRNFDTNDITEQMGMHISILKEFVKKDPSIDWYRMCGSRKRGLRVLCDDEEILEFEVIKETLESYPRNLLIDLQRQ